MRGLLIIDHGSRLEEANRQIAEVAAHVARSRPHDVVGWCHLEIMPPTLDDGFADLVGRGADHITLLPYFLNRGRHLAEDIPALARAAAQRHGVGHTVGPALGPHELLARLLLLRSGLDEESSG